MRFERHNQLMDSFRNHILVMFFITASIFFAAGQETKREFEKYISQDDFPEMIISSLQPLLEESRRTKFIEEYDDTLHTYEVKTLWNDRWVSIEFYEDGSLMDIEEIFEFDVEEINVTSAINSWLADSFKKFKIIRSQRQYIPRDSQESIETSILNFQNGNFGAFQKRYEIVVRVISHNEKTIGTFEFLFDRKGELIKWRRVKRMLTDNVLF